MMKNENNLLTLSPVENYEAPKIPTYQDEKPDLIKKVPARWKKKGIVAMAAIKALGVASLTGCTNQEPSFTPIADTGEATPAPSLGRSTVYCSDLHHGGSGGAPLYVAYLTEQEALNIIGQEFAQAGLNLNEALPRPRVNARDIYYELGNFGMAHTERTMFENYVEMQFIDEESGVGIVLINRWEWGIGWTCPTVVKESIEQRFQREHGISVHVIFEAGAWDWVDAERSLLLELAEERLTEQIEEVIDQIRAD